MSAPTSGPLVRALILRYGEHICPSKDTIGEHQSVLEEHGLMLFGKFGVGVALSRRQKLRRQIEADVPTYVYFAKRSGGRNLIHRARIVGIPEEDLSDRKHLVPAYYRDAMHTVSFWLLCDSLEEDPVAIRHLVVESSRSPLAEALGSSMSPRFNVIWSDKEVAGTARRQARRGRKRNRGRDASCETDLGEMDGEIPTLDRDTELGAWTADDPEDGEW